MFSKKKFSQILRNIKQLASFCFLLNFWMNKSTGSRKDLQRIWFREVVCVRERKKKRRRGKTWVTCSKLVNLDKWYMRILCITLETCLKFGGKDSKCLSKPRLHDPFFINASTWL